MSDKRTKKELLKEIEDQKQTIRAITNDLFLSGNREMVLQDKAKQVEADFELFRGQVIESGQAYDTVIDRLKRTLGAIINDMSDPERVARIAPRELKDPGEG